MTKQFSSIPSRTTSILPGSMRHKLDEVVFGELAYRDQRVGAARAQRAEFFEVEVAQAAVFVGDVVGAEVVDGRGNAAAGPAPDEALLGREVQQVQARLFGEAMQAGVVPEQIFEHALVFGGVGDDFEAVGGECVGLILAREDDEPVLATETRQATREVDLVLADAGAPRRPNTTLRILSWPKSTPFFRFRFERRRARPFACWPRFFWRRRRA